MAHNAVMILETGCEEFVLHALFDVVGGSSFIIGTATADFIFRKLFHNDNAMTHLLLQKACYDHIDTQALASDASRIHTATILRVYANIFDAQLESDDIALRIFLAIFRAPSHGGTHRAHRTGHREPRLR